MDRRRLIITNPYEAETHRVLDQVASKHGARVFSKVRVADVLDLNGSGVTNDQYSYALRAHFDFTVTDGDSRPLFSVEFDGRTHTVDPDTVRRDALKDAICDRLELPLLRIGDEFFRTIGRFSLLGWLAEVWFLDDGFTKAQESGQIPDTEIFHFGLIAGLGYRDQGHIVDISDLEASEQLRLIKEHEGQIVGTQPFDPFLPFRVYIQKSHDSGACLRSPPEELCESDPAGHSVAVAILPVTENRSVIGHARVRSFRFPPVGSAELATELAVVDAANKLMQFRENAVASSTETEVDAWRRRIEGWRRYR